MSQLQAEYNEFKQAIQQLSTKISELESESEEHKLVLETLESMEGTRKCMRMVGGVLVERTVSEVVPSLQATRQGLEKAIETLKGDLSKTEKGLDEWKVKHNVKVVST